MAASAVRSLHARFTLRASALVPRAAAAAAGPRPAAAAAAAMLPQAVQVRYHKSARPLIRSQHDSSMRSYDAACSGPCRALKGIAAAGEGLALYQVRRR